MKSSKATLSFTCGNWKTWSNSRLCRLILKLHLADQLLFCWYTLLLSFIDYITCFMSFQFPHIFLQDFQKRLQNGMWCFLLFLNKYGLMTGKRLWHTSVNSVSCRTFYVFRNILPKHNINQYNTGLKVIYYLDVSALKYSFKTCGYMLLSSMGKLYTLYREEEGQSCYSGPEAHFSLEAPNSSWIQPCWDTERQKAFLNSFQSQYTEARTVP